MLMTLLGNFVMLMALKWMSIMNSTGRYLTSNDALITGHSHTWVCRVFYGGNIWVKTTVSRCLTWYCSLPQRPYIVQNYVMSASQRISTNKKREKENRVDRGT